MLLALGATLLCAADRPAFPGLAASADDLAQVVRGKLVYAARCASCHGRNLQGQPLWRMADDGRHRRAPALNGSGRGWMSSDRALYAAIRDGGALRGARDPETRMPGFGGRLPDADILAVLAFIKARWPVALRVSQGLLTGGGSGGPTGADADWRFPADCKVR